MDILRDAYIDFTLVIGLYNRYFSYSPNSTENQQFSYNNNTVEIREFFPLYFNFEKKFTCLRKVRHISKSRKALGQIPASGKISSLSDVAQVQVRLTYSSNSHVFRESLDGYKASLRIGLKNNWKRLSNNFQSWKIPV